MYITQMDLLTQRLASEGAPTISDIIKHLIKTDLADPRKQAMLEGERYYEIDHDVMRHDFNKATVIDIDEDAEGKELESKEEFTSPNRSNHRNANPFHHVLVEQKASYIAGREPSITVEGDKTFEDLLGDIADEDFNDLLQDWIVEASNKALGWVHVYYDEAGELQRIIVPAQEILPVYDTPHLRNLKELLRYYAITVIRGNQEVRRYRVEWWTANDVTFYVQDEDGGYILDPDVAVNPRPHWWGVTRLNGAEIKREAHSWGRVPFVLLENNSKKLTDLEPIKGLIDAYDLVSSDGTNNFLDLVDLYWLVSGYDAGSASAMIKRLQVNRAMSISDAAGKVAAQQVELPVEGRLEWLKMLRRDIYHFGMGVDTDTDRLGNAPSGVSLKFQYTLLDLKANKMVPKLKKAMRELFWFIADDHNRNHGTAFDADKINIAINKTMITNDAELVDMIAKSVGVVSEKTLLAKNPLVDDVNAELKQLKAERQEAMAREEQQGTAGQFAKRGGDDA